MKKRVLLLFVLIISIHITTIAQIISQRHEGPFKTGNRIHLLLKNLHTDNSILTTNNKTSVRLIVNGQQIALDTITKSLGFQYEGEIPDSTQLIVEHPDFQKEKFTYLKKIHYKPNDAWIFVYLTPTKIMTNKIVVLGESVELYLKGKKKHYSIKQLGRTENNFSENAQMLKRIPDFKIEKDQIYVKDQVIHAIIIDGYLEYHRKQDAINSSLWRELNK